MQVDQLLGGARVGLHHECEGVVADGDDVNIGAPFISGAKVSAEIVSHGRGDKVTIIKFRRRKHHMKRQGHRQWFTEVKITGISA